MHRRTRLRVQNELDGGGIVGHLVFGPAVAHKAKMHHENWIHLSGLRKDASAEVSRGRLSFETEKWTGFPCFRFKPKVTILPARSKGDVLSQFSSWVAVIAALSDKARSGMFLSVFAFFSGLPQHNVYVSYVYRSRAGAARGLLSSSGLEAIATISMGEPSKPAAVAHR